MTTHESYRVLLPAHDVNIRKDRVTRTVDVAGRAFVILDDAGETEISRAKDLTKNGKTAGVLKRGLERPQAIFFDMDATVVVEETLVEIAKVAGKEQEIAELTARAMQGGMDFLESLRLRLKIMAGTPRESIESIELTYTPGVKELAAFARLNSIKIFLVTGGFIDVASKVAKSLFFDDFHANQFQWKDGRLTGELAGEIVDARGKELAVRRWCGQHGFDPKKCISVGDGANDVLMMRYCGGAVGFNPKKAIWGDLSVCNGLGDHRLLKELIS